MKSKFCLLALFVSCLTACVYDSPKPRVEIENQSDAKAIIELHFDKENYKPHWSKHEFAAFLTSNYGYSYPGPETQLISTDVNELIQNYDIPPKSIFVVAGWGDSNDIVLYNKIKIFKKSDTLSYESIEAIKKSFKRINPYCNKLVIK